MEYAEAVHSPGAPEGCGWWSDGESAPEPGTCAAFRLSGGREKPCWHSGGCPYKKAFDPDPGESEHVVDDLARLVEFCAFSMETSEAPDPNAPPPRGNAKPPMVKRYSLSLEKFRLALDLWGVVEPAARREALRWSAEFAAAAEGAKDAAILRQRKLRAK